MRDFACVQSRQHQLVGARLMIAGLKRSWLDRRERRHGIDRATGHHALVLSSPHHIFPDDLAPLLRKACEAFVAVRINRLAHGVRRYLPVERRIHAHTPEGISIEQSSRWGTTNRPRHFVADCRVGFRERNQSVDARPAGDVVVTPLLRKRLCSSGTDNGEDRDQPCACQLQFQIESGFHVSPQCVN
jgi:hypothetical protein